MRFLRPESPDVAAAKAFRVRVERVVDGKPAVVAWPAERVHWLFVRGNGFQSNRDAAPAVAGRAGVGAGAPAAIGDAESDRAGAAAGGDSPAGSRVAVAGNASELTIESPGVAMIGLDLKPVVEQVPRAEFARFLRERTATPPEIIAEWQRTPRAPDAPSDGAPGDGDAVRVRRVESMKTHVRVIEAAERADKDAGSGSADGAGDARRGREPRAAGVARGAREDDPAGVVMSKSGQAVEIRLMADPHALALGSDVPVRVYLASWGGAKLWATPDGGAPQELVTDSGGIARFKLSQAGVWRIECHHAEPIKSDAADWMLRSGTVTFEIAERGDGR